MMHWEPPDLAVGAPGQFTHEAPADPPSAISGRHQRFLPGSSPLFPRVLSWRSRGQDGRGFGKPVILRPFLLSFSGNCTNNSGSSLNILILKLAVTVILPWSPVESGVMWHHGVGDRLVLPGLTPGAVLCCLCHPRSPAQGLKGLTELTPFSEAAGAAPGKHQPQLLFLCLLPTSLLTPEPDSAQSSLHASLVYPACPWTVLRPGYLSARSLESGRLEPNLIVTN